MILYSLHMKLRLITIGKPRLTFTKLGWDEYFGRLQRFHSVRATHLSDKFAYDTAHILEAVKGTTICVLEIEGTEYTSEKLAHFLTERELESKEISFVIGGPDGLPQAVREAADYQWSLGRLTLPHDLAMIVTLEALYRASTINASLPYHR